MRPFSIGYMPSQIVVTGDAAAAKTASRAAHQGLLAAGLAGDVAVHPIETTLSVKRHPLMRPISVTDNQPTRLRAVARRAYEAAGIAAYPC